MINKDELQYFLAVFKDLKTSDIVDLFKNARIKTINSGDIYIHEGSTTTKLAFIKKGLIRCYFLKENGDEVTVILRWEGQFIASYDSIIFKRPARFVYQALEDTTVLELDYLTAQSIINKNLNLSTVQHMWLTHMLGEALERIESFILYSPEERYQKIIAEKPNITSRVQNKHLATLLGITPVSLSRIRKRIH